MEAVSLFSKGKSPTEDELINIGEIPDTSESGKFYSVLRTELLQLIYHPFLTLVQPNSMTGLKFSRFFAAAEYKNNSKVHCVKVGVGESMLRKPRAQIWHSEPSDAAAKGPKVLKSRRFLHSSCNYWLECCYFDSSRLHSTTSFTLVLIVTNHKHVRQSKIVI